ncbi:uncharacterized protein LOC124915331 [Impatiens glandulifera]|uniref:uncharacterized protein LOC124915331 n=1 Tax=Impatiens glandulifera TaxID=253017 RepID=UPI001FB05A33|nr:uncharacterized protein LOC124915331 [Impatiens glandulifera]
MSANPAVVYEDGSSGSGDDVNTLDGQNRQSLLGSSQRKKSRKATGDSIVGAMLEIAASSKMRANAMIKNGGDQFSVSKCIKVLDEMQVVDQHLYFFALDLLENPNCREIFIALKNEKRLKWLQGKFISSGAGGGGGVH